MNTPETDKFFATFADGEYAPSHAEYYARLQDLERQRDEARGQRDRLAAVLQSIRDGYGGQVADPDCDCGECEFLISIDNALKSLTTKP